MTGEPLSITSTRDGGAHRITAVGELDLATAGALRRELVDLDDAFETIVLDLSGVSFIDSTGLRIVLEFNERYGDPDDRLRVIAGSPAVDRLLEIVGLRDRLPLISP